jgi:hypothetical protein
MKAITTPGSLLLVCSLCAAAAAQPYAMPCAPWAHGYYPGHCWGYHHASTYEEGVLRGNADLQRAFGEAHYWHTLALINRQEAWARYLANRELNALTYFNLRQINREARDAERAQPLATWEYVVLAKKLAPECLDDTQYDRALGKLLWPAALRDDAFAAQRQALVELFAARASADSGCGSAFHVRVRQLTATSQEELVRRLRNHSIHQMDYLAAKKFLESLAYEAQKPFPVEAADAAE